MQRTPESQNPPISRPNLQRRGRLAGLTAVLLGLTVASAGAYQLNFSNLGVADGKPIPDGHGDVAGVLDVDYTSVNNDGENLFNHLRFKASASSLSGVAYSDLVPPSNRKPPGWGQIAFRPLDENKGVRVTNLQIVSLSGTRTVPVGVLDSATGASNEQNITVGTTPVTVNFNNFQGVAGTTVLVYWRAEAGAVAVDNVNYDVVSLTRTTYYVATNGQNVSSRDGRSPSTAWQTLSYACDRVPAGANTIKLGAGTFQETAICRVKGGVSIVGNGRSGTGKTTVLAPTALNFSGDGCTNNFDGYIIKVSYAPSVRIRDLELRDASNADTNGGIVLDKSNWVHVRNVHLQDFRYSGIYVQSDNYTINECYFQNASRPNYCNSSELASLMGLWGANGLIYDNEFYVDGNNGYGIRVRGQTQTWIYNNVFDGEGDFDIEIAHENEYGVQIFNNYFWGPVSLPKSGNQADPASAEYDLAIRAYDNISLSTYTFEGPRRFMEIDHNYAEHVRIGGNGRFYECHGGYSDGPTWIHHNVVENLYLNFTFIKGISKGLKYYNNTVYDGTVANTYSFFDVWDASSTGLEIKNNIFVTPVSGVHFITGGVNRTSTDTSVIDVRNNVIIGMDFSYLPSGRNNVSNYPGLNFGGDKPWPYFAPASASSYVVNRGVNVGLPYSGSAPDIGAYEYTAPAAVVKNSSFEDGTNHWQHTSSAWGLDGGSAYTGNYGLYHYDDQAYEEYTYQTVTNLTNGLHTITAWVWSTGGQTEASVWVGNYGGSWVSRSITGNSTWHQITIPNVDVTNGQCEIGIWSISGGGNYITVDDVAIRRQ